MTRTILAALAALAPLTLAACDVLPGRACNLMYAPSGVLVTFEADAWAPGTWEIEVDGLSCTVLLGTDALPTEQVVCEDGAAARLEIRLDEAGESIVQAHLIERTPDVVEIVVAHDDAVIVEASLVPEYVVDEPNGRGCGERRAASVTVEVPSPE